MVKYILAAIFVGLVPVHVLALTKIDEFKARPPIHISGSSTISPAGLSPEMIKTAYHLPKTGGNGTIAIIGAFDNPTIETDLNVFSKTFGLPVCTGATGCFEKHLIDKTTKSDPGWVLETSLDVEWAHAIAPNAKILLVSAKTASGTNLLKAVDYARMQPGVVAISMSWGGPEFAAETELDSHFASSTVTFFASSGDNGAGVSWPAVSPNVVGVGGTRLKIFSGDKISESAWAGSGGGISSFEPQPTFQSDYNIPKAQNMRAVPDVAFNADPNSGFSVYKSGKWYVVGGTSAGAPQWAAIKALGLSASNDKFYLDKSSVSSNAYFRDITSGTNGDCKYYCDARKHYDYVTGLGSPLTVTF